MNTKVLVLLCCLTLTVCFNFFAQYLEHIWDDKITLIRAEYKSKPFDYTGKISDAVGDATVRLEKKIKKLESDVSKLKGMTKEIARKHNEGNNEDMGNAGAWDISDPFEEGDDFDSSGDSLRGELIVRR